MTLGNIYYACEVDEPALHVSANQFDRKSVSHIDALLALRQQSIDARLQHADKSSFGSHAGDDGIEDGADAMPQRDRSQPLRHFPLDFSLRVSFFGAVGGDHGKLVIGVRVRLPGEHRLDQSLRHDVRKAAIGRGRVRVILHGQAEVSWRGLARPFQNIFSWAN